LILSKKTSKKLLTNNNKDEYDNQVAEMSDKDEIEKILNKEVVDIRF
jgi:hypothetical protein